MKEELPESRAYMEQKIQEAGLKREEFMGKAGDVFLWHGQLLHGGSCINEPSRTRKTLVTHYWRAGDVPRERCVRVHGAAFYEKREPAKCGWRDSLRYRRARIALGSYLAQGKINYGPGCG